MLILGESNDKSIQLYGALRFYNYILCFKVADRFILAPGFVDQNVKYMIHSLPSSRKAHMRKTMISWHNVSSQADSQKF